MVKRIFGTNHTFSFAHRYRTASFVNRRVEALGWGTTEFGGPISTKLLKVALDVVDLSRCQSAYPGRVTDAQVCTYAPNRDTCSYDSGGPLLFTDTVGNGLVYQVGITSYGEACATSRPSVSTRITAYLDWIRSATPDAVYCEL